MKKTHYFGSQCSVCNSTIYGFGDWKLNVINPGLKCQQKNCDGLCFLIFQTTNKNEWQAKTNALEDYKKEKASIS